jgi:hypothetical protein
METLRKWRVVDCWRLGRFKVLGVAGSLLLMLSLCSCGPVEWEDVSSQKPHSEAIGKKFRLREDMLLLGISVKTPAGLPPDYFLLMRRPGIGGYEVVDRGELKKGTVVQVVGVLVPKHGLDRFLGRIDRYRGVYVVGGVEGKQLREQPIWIKLIDDPENELYGLNAFEEMK